jgi:hypothetical protein
MSVAEVMADLLAEDPGARVELEAGSVADGVRYTIRIAEHAFPIRDADLVKVADATGIYSIAASAVAPGLDPGTVAQLAGGRFRADEVDAVIREARIWFLHQNGRHWGGLRGPEARRAVAFRAAGVLCEERGASSKAARLLLAALHPLEDYQRRWNGKAWPSPGYLR